MIAPDYLKQANRHYDALYAEQEDDVREFKNNRDSFTRVFLTKDMSDTTLLDGMREKWTPSGTSAGKRLATVGEMVYELMDIGKAPTWDDVFAFIQSHASRGDPLALKFVERLADEFARQKAG